MSIKKVCSLSLNCVMPLFPLKTQIFHRLIQELWLDISLSARTIPVFFELGEGLSCQEFDFNPMIDWAMIEMRSLRIFWIAN